MRDGRRNLLRGMAGLLAGSAMAPLTPVDAADVERPRYKDASLPVDVRVDDLLRRMTLEEKVAQLIALWSTQKDVLGAGSDEFSAARASKAYPHGFGQVTRASDRK